MTYDSPGGYGLEFFLPKCVCGHPVESHRRHDTGKPRRKCQVGTPDECPCKEYTAGDPKNWPPPPPIQEPLPLMSTAGPTSTTLDLDLLDNAIDLVGHIPDPISDYLEWVLFTQSHSLAAHELRRILRDINR